jgi:hypothetical protein
MLIRLRLSRLDSSITRRCVQLHILAICQTMDRLVDPSFSDFFFSDSFAVSEMSNAVAICWFAVA